LHGGDEHQDLLAHVLFSGPGINRLFSVPKGELRAGGPLYGLGDPPEDLGWGAKDN
jgi:hypothetical protein